MAEVAADVSLYDDGKLIYVGLYCREPVAMSEGLQAVARAADGKQRDVLRTSDMHARITFEGDHDEALSIARRAVATACATMTALGYKPGVRHGQGG
jgi:isopropylmalate/homocitrate/citramalate synthase